MSASAVQEFVEDVAVIGMAGRFPGAGNIERFWQNVRDGVSTVTFFSREELEASGVSRAVLDHPHHVGARAVLDGAELFDAPFFEFTRRAAEFMDPQHRIFLECAWEALEAAGYDSERFDGRIGVYAGAGLNKYLLAIYPQLAELESADALQVIIANEKDHLPTLVSYKLNLKGPSINIQTACSTSLVAVCVACESLLDYQCDMALAGAVAIKVPQTTGYIYQDGGIMSPDGICRPFDADATGTISGNGVGIVVLRRLSDALCDGDYVHAIIKGFAVNNDGALRIGYTAPSVDGQAEVIADALSMSRVNPERITYVETHGTGTVLGDPIEIAALTQAFHPSTQRKGFCAIGSVKANVGHLDTAAGVAGLIKTIEALKHKQLPPSLHFRRPNLSIDFTNSPFYVNTTLRDWKSEGSRCAGVSSFGIGGTNAHVVVEESPCVDNLSTQPEAERISGQTVRPHLLILSAKTETALHQAAANLAAHLKQHVDLGLVDVAYTLQVGRRAFNWRLILVCQTIDTAVSGLTTLDVSRVHTSFQEDRKRPVVMMFPGQGTQYVNMARGLYENELLFRKHVDDCAALLAPELGFDLRSAVYPEGAKEQEATERLRQTDLAQVSLFVVEYALAQVWIKWGVRPQALIGHSIGEYVAACLAGVFSLEEALLLVATRGRLMAQLSEGAMLAVSLSEQETSDLLGEGLSLAASNASAQCVVSGATSAVRSLESQLAKMGVVAKRLDTRHAFHSQEMDQIIEPFAGEVRKAHLRAPQIPLVSNVTGTWMSASEATDPYYWARQLCQTVQFKKGLVELLKEPERVMLEVGPRGTLSSFVMQHPARMTRQFALSSLRHPSETQADETFLLGVLGQLWLAGVDVDWRGGYVDEQRRRVPLPTYPFERQIYSLMGQGVGQCCAQQVGTVQTQTPAELEVTSVSDNGSPQDEPEQLILEIWQEVFGLEHVGVHDNFFDLGGNSLIGIQLMARLRKKFQMELPMRHLFESPTVAGLASVIANTKVKTHDLEEIEQILTEIENLSAQNRHA